MCHSLVQHQGSPYKPAKTKKVNKKGKAQNKSRDDFNIATSGESDRSTPSDINGSNREYLQKFLPQSYGDSFIHKKTVFRICYFHWTLAK